MTEPSTPNSPPQKSNTGLVALALITAVIIGALGFTHIVQTSHRVMSRTSHGVVFIPKEHFSFSMTFTSVDEVLQRTNSSRSHDPLLEHLVQALERKKMIK